MAIDIDSSKIKWEIKDFVVDEKYKKYLAFGTSNASTTPMRWVQNIETKSIYLLARHFCWRIDLKMQCATLISDFLDMDITNRWNIKEATLHNNKLYFIGSQGFEFYPNIIGVYDIDQRQVIDYAKIENGYFRNSPQIINNEITVQDSNGKLHLYS